MSILGSTLLGPEGMLELEVWQTEHIELSLCLFALAKDIVPFHSAWKIRPCSSTMSTTDRHVGITGRRLQVSEKSEYYIPTPLGDSARSSCPDRWEIPSILASVSPNCDKKIRLTPFELGGNPDRSTWPKHSLPYCRPDLVEVRMLASDVDDENRK